MKFTAWQLIGWEGDCGAVRRVNGRQTYTDVMYNCATARTNNVKLARLDPGPREVRQIVGPDEMLEIIGITKRGEQFLREQDLAP